MEGRVTILPSPRQFVCFVAAVASIYGLDDVVVVDAVWLRGCVRASLGWVWSCVGPLV